MILWLICKTANVTKKTFTGPFLSIDASSAISFCYPIHLSTTYSSRRNHFTFPCSLFPGVSGGSRCAPTTSTRQLRGNTFLRHDALPAGPAVCLNTLRLQLQGHIKGLPAMTQHVLTVIYLKRHTELCMQPDGLGCVRLQTLNISEWKSVFKMNV